VTARAETLRITPDLWRSLALSDAEFSRIVELLRREPSIVELGMFGSMWSEHCGYKHSRPLFPLMPTEADYVVQGPGENAGAVDIGNGLAAVFKVESHNHPSAVEPYQGAATGVGGIVRDIFTMGARPVAILDSLRFGPLDSERNRYLFENVVGGIGDYGNCLGIPNVGGEVYFDESYNGNPLVNAMCVGVVEISQLMRARASGVGNVVMIIGAETGRDGLHGATFASVEDPEASHRGVVQVGNPFLEKLLLEACLELLQGDDVVALQDLGAAGLTSSAVECAARGGVGIDIDVARVPRREPGLTPFEVMLSESQERMLLVVRPEGVERVRSIVAKWSLKSAEIGTVTDTANVVIREGEQVVCDVPATFFTDECPTYIREAAEDPAIAAARSADWRDIRDIAPDAVAETTLALLGAANIGSRRSVFRRYDSTIMTSTVVGPGPSDAAVVRIKGRESGLAISLDCNSRYCYLDPYRGAQLAVAEALRNVSCAGGRPLAITNCLNFRNPEKPAGYFQLSRAVAGMADACTALGVVVVSGNVSLYNETSDSAIFPTPTIGCVGVVDDVRNHARTIWREGDQILLIGGGEPTLGGSEYLAALHGRTIGEPPVLDLEHEAKVQRVVREAIAAGEVRTAHDVSLGGLAVAIAEMAIHSGIGVMISLPADGRSDLFWFGERASSILVAVETAQAAAVLYRAAAANVPATVIGTAIATEIVYGPGDSVALTVANERYESALSADTA
jgi:phosphoribosylformylglycinamidine synthase subunit PurL